MSSSLRPAEWSDVPLGDVLIALRNGTTAAQSREPTPFPVARIETIADGAIDLRHVGYLDAPDERYRLARGDVLLSHVNAVTHIGKVALIDRDDPLYHGMNLMLLRPDVARIAPGFLYAVLASSGGRAYARRECKSAINQASLSQSDIRRFRFGLPPRGEQEQIGKVLHAIDEAIRRTEQIVKKLGQVNEGLLPALLTRGIDENGELRDPDRHPEQLKDSRLGPIPKEWSITRLDQVADIARGRFPHRPRNDPAYYGGAFPFIQTGDIAAAEGGALWAASQHLNERGAAISRQFSAGAIAITIAAHIGDTATLGAPMYFPDSVVGAVVREPHHPRFTQMCIQQAKQALHARATQSAQKNINLKDVRSLLLVSPPPREQALIAERYDAMVTARQNEAVLLDKLRLLRSAVTEDLLTGRVRVR